jgi:hypothetical protein
LTLDLIGLPPTPEEVDAFIADTAPDAYERLVDRLLASPHYGERMALPWLDAARYADSNGFQQDGDTCQWVWRDWVVRRTECRHALRSILDRAARRRSAAKSDAGSAHRHWIQSQPPAQWRRRRDPRRAAVQQSLRSR